MFELYIKYLLEGIAVAVAAYFIPRKKVEISEIIFIALSAAATFAVLDIFAPKVGDSARKGAGFGIGANTVGWPMGGAENFNGESDEIMDSDDSDDSDDSSNSSDPEHFTYGGIKKVSGDGSDGGEHFDQHDTKGMKKDMKKDKKKKDDKKKKVKVPSAAEPKDLKDSPMKGGESFEGSSVSSTVSSTVSSVVSKVTGDCKSADTTADTKSADTKSTESAESKSLDSNNSAVTAYDDTKQYSSF